MKELRKLNENYVKSKRKWKTVNEVTRKELTHKHICTRNTKFCH